MLRKYDESYRCEENCDLRYARPSAYLGKTFVDCANDSEFRKVEEAREAQVREVLGERFKVDYLQIAVGSGPADSCKDAGHEIACKNSNNKRDCLKGLISFNRR